MNNRFFWLHLHVVPFFVWISRPSLIVALECNFLAVNCSSKASDVTLNWPDLTLQLFNFFFNSSTFVWFCCVRVMIFFRWCFQHLACWSLIGPSSCFMQFFSALTLTSLGLTIGQPICVILGPSFYCWLCVIFRLQFWGGHFLKNGVRHWSKTYTVKPSP